MRATLWMGVWAVMFAAGAGLALAQAGPAGTGSSGQGAGGNAVLMQRQAEAQRRIRDEVLRVLGQAGRLPENGTVSFTALAVPDPAQAGRLRVRIESLTIVPAPGTAGNAPAGADDPGRDMARALSPVDISDIVSVEALDIPVGETVRDTVTMKAGRPEPTGPPAAQGKRGQP